MQEKVIETKKCEHCNTNFDFTDKDLEFYDKFSPVFDNIKFQIDIPTFCPKCREQRRLSWRNERKLYKRKCDATGEDIISIYNPEYSYKVFNGNYWWSDKWNSLDYGKDFDFSKGFFQQFGKIFNNTPKLSIIGSNNENSDYCNLCADNKNCYLITESSNNEDCYFGHWLQKCNNCIDCNFMHESDNCYQCNNCFNCYFSFYLSNSKNCRNSYFLEDCIGCNNCFGCVGIQNKEYYFFNEKLSKRKYEEKISAIIINDSIKRKFDDFNRKIPKKYARILRSENCSGSQIEDCKNCIECFHAYDAENCKYAEHVWRNAKNCMDVSTAGRDAELIFETINCGIGVYKNSFCSVVWSSNNMTYCFSCFNSNNCFGCVGLKNNSYCILNKQYTKEEYNDLVPKIIKHMRKTGEWGEFFPANLSPFGYNETVANEYFPLTKQDALKLGFTRSNYEQPIPKVEKIIPANKLPENIYDIPDDILNWAVECENTNKPFRIISQELDFYRKHNLPIPKKHPDQRHLDRMNFKNPRILFDRKCDKCLIEIKTTYSSDREEKVYCEKCYNKEIY